MEFEVEGIENSKQSGKIAIVYPDLDEMTRSFRCRVFVDNSEGKYRPGLLGQVAVVIGEATDALSIPASALTQTAAGWQVLVSENGRPVPRPVEVGLMTEKQVEIRKGLEENDSVFIPKTLK